MQTPPPTPINIDDAVELLSPFRLSDSADPLTIALNEAFYAQTLCLDEPWGARQLNSFSFSSASSDEPEANDWLGPLSPLLLQLVLAEDAGSLAAAGAELGELRESYPGLDAVKTVHLLAKNHQLWLRGRERELLREIGEGGGGDRADDGAGWSNYF
ncbi:hypothetical protein TeGR_g9563 [Tetraparma gracilis]|uniref:Uncharacterized protein n=1 Tax=Tetraparma gracilis TaxID=2962635 RepID=A0ABQ6N3X5_9STRA|nr:hypothetical protein TeGR_g9563 [Tetraparma gracilis]